MAYIKGKKGDAVTGEGFERGRDTQEELWQMAEMTERRRGVLLPALLSTALNKLITKAGGEARDDVTTLLSRAAALPIMGLNAQVAVNLTKGVLGAAHSIIDAADPEDEAEAVMVVAALILKIADERRMPMNDYESQALLVAVMIFEEARSNSTVGWELREERLEPMIQKMLDRANLTGIPLL